MTDTAPERIWATQVGRFEWLPTASPPANREGTTPVAEYIRADLVAAKDTEIERLNGKLIPILAAAKRVENIQDDMREFDGDRRGHLAALHEANEDVEIAILAALEGESE